MYHHDPTKLDLLEIWIHNNIDLIVIGGVIAVALISEFVANRLQR